MARSTEEGKCVCVCVFLLRETSWLSFFFRSFFIQMSVCVCVRVGDFEFFSRGEFWVSQVQQQESEETIFGCEIKRVIWDEGLHNENGKERKYLTVP